MLKQTTTFTAALAAIALLNPGTHAQDANSPAAGQAGATAATTGAGQAGPTLSPTDQLFLLRSAQGDMAEIMTSKMALKKSGNSDVKQVAQRLITDHSQSLQEGMGVATLFGITPPKDPGIMNQAFAMRLSDAGGKDFDKMFMAGQAEAHENTIALYTVELTQGQNPQVKAFAAKYLPGIESHTAMIYQTAQAVNAPDMNLRPAAPPTVSPSLTAGLDNGMGTGASSGSSTMGMGTGAGGTGTTGASGTGTTGTGASGDGGTTGAGGAGATGTGTAGAGTTG